MTEILDLVLKIAGLVIITTIGLGMFGYLGYVLHSIRERRKKAVAPVVQEFARVGGRTVAMGDWSPELLNEIRKQYFRPPLNGQHVLLMDITATCARSHATRERIVLIARNSTIAKEIADGILRSRADINCDECGKRARLSGKSVVWEGLTEQWDAAV